MKRIISGISLMLLLATFFMFAMKTPKIQAIYECEIYSDDFSTDSGMWKYLGSAYRDPVNQYLVLTEPVNYQGGVAFFNVTFKTSFTANFSYKAGDGSGADGFVMFFYKQNYSSFANGGNMAFNDDWQPCPGYGIEFDNWWNGYFNDPSSNHIALIENFVDTHLIFVDDLRTEDNLWHDVSVEVEESTVTVFVDQSLVFQWNGELNRTFNYFGFCGGTGYATNWHIIDNFSIKVLAPTPSTIDAGVEIKPKSLNLKSEGRWITTYIELPEGYNVNNINVSAILLNNTISAEPNPITIDDYDNDGISDLMVKFDRAAVQTYILANVNMTELCEKRFMIITLTISGSLNDGASFQGSDTIKIIMTKYLIMPE